MLKCFKITSKEVPDYRIAFITGRGAERGRGPGAALFRTPEAP